ncbi:32618_t:CDS:2, partial [Gigaspora margarita]
SSQSDSEFLNLEDYYETSDNYETTDNECSNNRSIVSSKQTLKKKRIRGMNSETIINKQAELANHPDVLEILNPLCVRCKNCKKQIKLKRNYEKSRIESHVSSSSCIKNKGFRDLKEFFSNSNSQNEPLFHRRYPCSGLLGGFTIFGGAPPIKEVAQELFSKKFTKVTKFSYNKLTSDQSKRLNDELSARS